jgi:predicted acylesterase/phospholipase RssA
MPIGIFDNRAVDAFLAQLFAAPGRTNDFRKLRNKLFLVATNLDSGESVTFGAPGRDHVPISRAIEASSALPGLFPPVEIDGEHYLDGALNKTLHASVALEEGVTLLLCVNPLVPFDASAATRSGRLTIAKMNQRGLPLVLAQTFRAIIHSRMQVGMEKYQRQYPHADILLFEPDREDADMFFANIFSYAQRKRLCELAFATTRQSLLARAEVMAPAWKRHGLTLDLERLADQTRRVTDTLNDPRPLHPNTRRRSVAQTTRDLAHTLTQLERTMGARR